MNRLPFAFFIAALLCGLPYLSAHRAIAQSLNDRMSASVKRVYGESAIFSSASATLSDKEGADIKSASGFAYGPTVSYYAVAVGGKRVGYAIVDEVRGKAKLITYAVFVDNNITIRDLEVLVYREPYGGEIQYDAFRRQFRGKGPKDQYKVGVDVRNVSGATISTNAVTGGTRKLIAVLRELKGAGKLR
ncbi:MAG: FMN-binding protein [Bacteroidota bacterium]